MGGAATVGVGVGCVRVRISYFRNYYVLFLSISIYSSFFY